MSTRNQDPSPPPARPKKGKSPESSEPPRTDGHKNERIHLVLRIISTASIFFAAVSVVIAYLAYEAQNEWSRKQHEITRKEYAEYHEWERRKNAVELLRNYATDAAPHSVALNRAFPMLIHSEQVAPLAKREAKKIYEMQNERRKHIVAFLNYMEQVCIAYEANVVNQDIIYKAFNGLFVRRYEFFKAFIDHAQDEQENKRGNKHSWQPIVRVVGEWQRRDTPAPQILPPTGNLPEEKPSK